MTQQALQRLKEGNQRFVAGNPLHQHESSQWRAGLTTGQHPFATVLGCSDSRVSVELLFDQGFGDLFVIRVAGNVIGENVIGSIEYAVDHLHTPLVLIMGHEGCGAVTAALEPEATQQREPDDMQRLLSHIAPALKNIDRSLPKADLVAAGVEANVRWSLKQLQRVAELREKIAEGSLKIGGSVYELKTGQVRMME